MTTHTTTPVEFNPFLSTAIEHGYLNETEAIRVRKATIRMNESSAEVALRLGVLDGVDIECVRALAQPRASIPGYELLDVLGVGGMGIVFYARQTKMDRKVALKVLSKSRCCDAEAKRRFRRESLAVGRMRHPNIVTAFDSGETATQHYLAMEFVDGVDLEEWVDSFGAMSEFHAWSVIRQVCLGLKHATAQGVIHRDIKPPNIILVENSHRANRRRGAAEDISSLATPIAKIADFGLAIRFGNGVASDRVTAANTFLGSPPYVAPEQLANAALDHRCDIYALGATALHLLSGTVPYRGMTVPEILSAKLRQRSLPIGLELAHCSVMSRNLVAEMMEPKPNRRLSCYDSIIQRIDQILVRDETQELAKTMHVSSRSSGLRQSIGAIHLNQTPSRPSVEIDPHRHAVRVRRPQRSTIRMKHAYGVGWVCVTILAIASILRFDSELQRVDEEEAQRLAFNESIGGHELHDWASNKLNPRWDRLDRDRRRVDPNAKDETIFGSTWQGLTRLVHSRGSVGAFEPTNESNQTNAGMYGNANAPANHVHGNNLVDVEGAEGHRKLNADPEKRGLMEGMVGRIDIAALPKVDEERPAQINPGLRPITHVSLPVQVQPQPQPIVVLPPPPPPRQEPPFLNVFLGGGGPVDGPGGGHGQHRRGGRR